jgi:hypothetical protein
MVSNTELVPDPPAKGEIFTPPAPPLPTVTVYEAGAVIEYDVLDL